MGLFLCFILLVLIFIFVLLGLVLIASALEGIANGLDNK